MIIQGVDLVRPNAHINAAMHSEAAILKTKKLTILAKKIKMIKKAKG
jgi:hypothetical protein